MSRELTSIQAIHEALDLSLARDPNVYVMGLGVPDPRAIFGSTRGLQEKYGASRVMDMPCAENGMTGIALGTALVGMRPIMVHQRLDFAILALEQIVNQAAKWHYMFDGRQRIPLVIRLIIGRGWGQGPQHSQSLQSWFAHIPGLKVAMPVTPHDHKGLLLSSIADDNPVLFLEHRWLHSLTGHVPESDFRTPLGKCRIARRGTDVTLVGISYSVIDCLRAADTLAQEGIEAEVIDVRSLQPFDDRTVVQSVERTGRLVVADTGWRSCGFAAEVVARVAEQAAHAFTCSPRRITLPDCPTPTTPALSAVYYPQPADIVRAVRQMMERDEDYMQREEAMTALDVPDTSFTGPF